MEEQIKKEFPVIFQRLNTYEAQDNRFMEVKIWLMHTGANLNGSYFSKESIIEAIPSLKNTPILAYIENNIYGEKDFADHRMELVKDDGQYKIKYLCNAIGVIPEENDAKFEYRLCDDGVEREFLTVKGLVWQKWDDPIDIFNRDIIKAQSMELSDDYEGYWGEDKLFHFTKFKFFGACALGKTVQPAMHNASIEVQFNMNNIFSTIQSKMEEFKHFFTNLKSPSMEVDINNDMQGGTEVDEILKMLESYNLKLEDLQAKNINYEKLSLTDLEEIIKSEFNQKTNDKPDDKFALTVTQLQEEAYRSLAEFGEIVDEYWGFSYPKYGLVDIDTENNYVIAYDYENWYLVGFDYTLDGDKVNIDKESLRRFKVSYQPMELGQESPNMFELVKDHFTKAQKIYINYKSEVEAKLTEKENELTTLNEQFATVKTELESTLEKYKAKVKQEREEQENQIFSAFAKELSEEEMKEVKENKDSMTLDEIQDKLFALVGKKKAKFNFYEQKTQIIDLEIETPKQSKTGKSYEELFEKYNLI